MFQLDDFFGHHLKHVTEHLDASPLSYTVRSQTALEETAHLTLHINKENGKYGVQGHNAHPDYDTFNEYSQPLRHNGGQSLVYPACYYTKVKHMLYLRLHDLLFTYLSISGTT